MIPYTYSEIVDLTNEIQEVGFLELLKELVMLNHERYSDYLLLDITDRLDFKITVLRLNK